MPQDLLIKRDNRRENSIKGLITKGRNLIKSLEGFMYKEVLPALKGLLVMFERENYKIT